MLKTVKVTTEKSFDLTPELMLRAADALEYAARMEAGMSQAPGLIWYEDTEEWEDAQAIRAAVEQGLLP